MTQFNFDQQVENMKELTDLLDGCSKRIERLDGTNVVFELCGYLRQLLGTMNDDEWRSTVVPLCRNHPIQRLLLEDPYTARAYLKPRGYAGDAVMLDYIYSAVPPTGTTAVGSSIFGGTTGLQNGRSVVARRDLLTRRIDETAKFRPEPKVLSLACGHLREAQYCNSVANRQISEFIAFDQDAESLSVVNQNHPDTAFRTVCGSVVDVLRRRVTFTDFDFVYAAGLFDYLTDSLARRLLTRMWEMVRPGGRVLIANFTPNNHGRGYMECFMDWTLIYRNEEALLNLLDPDKLGLITNQRVYPDAYNNVVYLEFDKA